MFAFVYHDKTYEEKNARGKFTMWAERVLGHRKNFNIFWKFSKYYSGLTLWQETWIVIITAPSAQLSVLPL